MRTRVYFCAFVIPSLSALVLGHPIIRLYLQYLKEYSHGFRALSKHDGNALFGTTAMNDAIQTWNGKQTWLACGIFSEVAPES